MSSSLNDIRQTFIDYFVENGHRHVESSSLIPDNDPTLLFTNAGMVQFKDVFTGKKVLPFKRATTAQKCVRAGGKHNDLENVGYTARHHTFFEMLGNFSFGDYFKEEVIEFAWKLVTREFNLPREKLLVTVHSSDEDAARIWRKISGMEDSKIIRISTSDNFWSMGNTGPCGPCSEIFYDHGDKVQGGPPGSKDEDGDRFTEIWNLVFMQFEMQENGERASLPKPSIDTGMGLERIAAILQGVHSNYDIDLFKAIISDIKNITGTDDPKFSSHNNVIADHIRSISFMISDGLTPTNEGRGYVLRRIIRRALRHGYMMGMREPFLYKLVSSVKNAMGSFYGELVSNEQTIAQIVKNEEEGFMKTIDKGMSILKSEIDKLGSSNIFPADIAFRLYDTYGFPFDLTQDILKNEGKKANEAEFDKIVSEQRTLSKGAWIGTGDSFTDKVWFDIAHDIKNDTEFLRKTQKLESKVLAIVSNSKSINQAPKGEECFFVTLKTPFYPECGGQIGDSGIITSQDGIAHISDTKTIAGLIVHKGIVETGSFSVGDRVTLEIDQKKRLATSRNHTATHLLQASLRKILGDHVAQKGSLVDHEKLRFDFIHNSSLERSEVSKIEELVRDAIDCSMEVSTQVMSIEEARSSGALALFGERYPEKVRVVTIGNNFSKELCGGEHVSNTSEIGGFKIISVSSIGSGIKRIEAISGRHLIEYLDREIARMSKRIETQDSEIKSLGKQLSDLKTKSISNNVKINCTELKGISLKYATLEGANQKVVLSIVDKEKEIQNKKTCLIIGNISYNSKTGEKKVSVCLFLSKTLVDSGCKARDLITNLGIRCGGRDDLVQFGGIDLQTFDKLLQAVRDILVNEYGK